MRCDVVERLDLIRGKSVNNDGGRTSRRGRADDVFNRPRFAVGGLD